METIINDIKVLYSLCYPNCANNTAIPREGFCPDVFTRLQQYNFAHATIQGRAFL